MRFSILFAAACLAVTAVAEDSKKIVCYFGSWAAYRQGQGKFEIEAIDPFLCTHLVYTFVGLEGDNVKLLDPWQDLPNDGGKNAFARFNALRVKNKDLKTMIAIGGWTQGSAAYSAMARNPSSRSRFVKNVVEFVKKYNFDGFDFDWEYPNQRDGSNRADVDNFVAVLRELSQALKKEGLLLSAAVGAAESSASLSYNIAEISKLLDFINLMSYDLHGPWDHQTGINAPLFPASTESGNHAKLNVDSAVKYWLSKGADPKKLMVGTASYGRSFTLTNPKATKVGSPTSGPGAAGPYTKAKGMLGYNEICELREKEGWTVEYDEERQAPFAHHKNQWVGYDDVKSIAAKAQYIKDNGLGGAMMWSIETDDFRGNCGEKYPLLKTLNHVLRNGKAVVERPPSAPRLSEDRPIPESENQPITKSEDQPTSESDEPICTGHGYLPYATTCAKFVQCVDYGNGEFHGETLDCPEGLCFNPEISVCDWPKK